MKERLKLSEIIEIDLNNEIPVSNLIKAIDKSKDFFIYEINNSEDTLYEKNILININKKGGLNNVI